MHDKQNLSPAACVVRILAGEHNCLIGLYKAVDKWRYEYERPRH